MSSAIKPAVTVGEVDAQAGAAAEDLASLGFHSRSTPEIWSQHPRASVGRDEHYVQALVGSALDRLAGSGRVGSMKAGFSGQGGATLDGEVEPFVHPRGTAPPQRAWGTSALSRNLSNLPSDPPMKGLGCNVRAIGPNDGAQALVEFYAGEIGRV